MVALLVVVRRRLVSRAGARRPRRAGASRAGSAGYGVWFGACSCGIVAGATASAQP